MFSCDYCGDVFTENRSLTRHIISVHEKKEYECDHCDYTANRKDNIKGTQSRCKKNQYIKD